MGLAGYFVSVRPKSEERPALMAAKGPVKTDRVTGWMFIGFLRECFKRNRNAKRKEEEQ